MQDPAGLKFSVRPDARPRRKASRSPIYHWWFVALLGALVFLVVRGMLVRGADTAGPSQQASYVAPDQPLAEVRVDDAIQVDATPMVYKCVGKDGAVSFQSFACATNESTRGAYAARPDTRRDVEIAREKQRDATRQANVMSRMAGTDRAGASVAWSSDFDARRARCESAKTHRANTLRAVGLARTYELLQRLDEIVREACKGT